MQLRGTTIENVDVEISNSQIIDAAVTVAKEKYDEFIPYDHIDKDGYWQEWQFDSPHNGNPVYVRKRKATKKELEVKIFIDKLKALQHYNE